MLVITRKPDQSITLRHPDGTQITVTVCKNRGGSVRVGIDAPAEWLIRRTEIDTPADTMEA